MLFLVLVLAPKDRSSLLPHGASSEAPTTAESDGAVTISRSPQRTVQTHPPFTGVQSSRALTMCVNGSTAEVEALDVLWQGSLCARPASPRR